MKRILQKAITILLVFFLIIFLCGVASLQFIESYAAGMPILICIILSTFGLSICTRTLGHLNKILKITHKS